MFGNDLSVILCADGYGAVLRDVEVLRIDVVVPKVGACKHRSDIAARGLVFWLDAVLLERPTQANSVTDGGKDGNRNAARTADTKSWQFGPKW